MTDTPTVDHGESTDAPSADAQARERFARHTAEVLGYWAEGQDWQRQAIHAIYPALGRALWLADAAVDDMTGCDARVRTTDGTLIRCGTDLVDDVCPFEGHHVREG